MILTQKYHSANEIDAEFVPSIEDLLKDCVPSFEWIKKNENCHPDSTHFHYYLFFGQKHNCPIGYAQVAIRPKERLESFWKSLFNKNKKKILRHKEAFWRIPGSQGQAVVYGPHYTDSILQKTVALVEDFSKRDDIAFQELAISRENLVFSQSFRPYKNIVIVPDTLIKVAPTYEEYLKRIAPTSSKIIQENWKYLYQVYGIEIGDYENFKAVFAYKNGAAQYKKLRKNPFIKTMQEQCTRFLTMERNGKVLGIVFLIKGQGHHYFFDWIKLDSKISELAMIQLAVMKFYEIEDAFRFHYLGNKNEYELFSNIGFTSTQLTLFGLNHEQ